MSPFEKLTPEQKEAVTQLRKEIKDLNLQSDEMWASYVKTGDQECFEAVRAIDSEVEMKGLIAYLPKAGEGKIAKIRKLVNKVKAMTDESETCEGCEELPRVYETRLDTLASINAWREEYGIPLLDRLPKGIMGDPHDCVIARAFHIDEMTIDDEVWQFYEVNISGESGNKLSLWRDNDEGHRLYKEFDLTGEGWGGLVSNFDSGIYWDLVDRDSLVDAVIGRLDAGGTMPIAGLEACFQEGLAAEVASSVNYNDTGIRLEFEGGAFTWSQQEWNQETEDHDWEVVGTYEVGTASLISEQYVS